MALAHKALLHPPYVNRDLKYIYTNLIICTPNLNTLKIKFNY